jgi:predicted flavoprotein YhiN
VSDDIENTINNFLIEAAAMRAALDQQSSRVVTLTETLRQTSTESLRSRKSLADMLEQGVQKQAVQQITAACRPLIESSSTAAKQAERAMASKLKEVEVSQVRGWLMNSLIAFAAGTISAILALLFVKFFPGAVGL